MARRRKTKKTTSHRRRRVSGVALNAKNPIVSIGSIAAGYFIGTKINDALSNVIPSTIDPKIVAAAEAVAGYLIRSKVKGMPGAVVGGVLLGAGIKKGLQAFGVVSGIPVVNGYRDLRTINGLPAPVKRIAGPAQGLSTSLNVISGIDSASGYTDNDY